MSIKKISVIGSGWLGLPFIDKISQKSNFRILGMSRTLPHLKENFQSSVEFLTLDLELFFENPSQFLNVVNDINNSDIIIYTIPPLPLKIIQHFFQYLSKDKKIIFTSSTSVYGKNLGPEILDENYSLDKNNTNSPLLMETEEFLMSHFKNMIILRLGGLYGLKRHPIFFLQGKSQLQTGNDFLHLTSLNDCLNALLKLVAIEQWPAGVINIVSDLRITKKEYYTFMATKLNLALPQYSEKQTNNGHSTRISNQKSKNLLDLNYEDPKDYNI